MDQRQSAFIIVVLACCQLLGPAIAQDVSSISSVKPFIGTAGHGHTYPGATVPFGMVQLSPDTFTEGWDWCSGYHQSDDSILGFSHTHLSGTGCGDLGDILFAPTTGKVNLSPGTREEPEKGYRSRINRAIQRASPGYYTVLLKTYGVVAEMTATKHVGIHRYKFPRTDKANKANIIIDLVHGIQDKPIAVELNIAGDHTVTGMRRSKGWAKDQCVYFAAEFSKPFTSCGVAVDDDKPQIGERHAAGSHAKGWVTFNATDGAPIVAKVALSTTSVDGALRNLMAEANGWNFDLYRDNARKEWHKVLDKIQLPGAAMAERETFYTALYHCMLAPTIISDVDGQFRGSDLCVHQAKGVENYSTFSLWDTFRAEHPLFTILTPELVPDMLRSFKSQADFHKDKKLPIWPLYANETYCMIGYHSFPVIAEAYLKGIKTPDVQALFDLMVSNSKVNDWWADRGYMPADKEGESVSKTLEFAYDDWTLAQLAKSLGKDAEYRKFLKRSEAYKNVFDKKTGFMRGRLADGSWRTPFDPTLVSDPNKFRDFTEANAWQYTWFVPHDVQGLINLMGGRNRFVKKLDALFEQQGVKQDTKDLDVSGLIGQYAQGNEPSHHVAYLYCYAGAPWKTQERVQQIRQELYNNTDEGLCGNEDCGQMSAWYVFSALGFYPVNPVEGIYVIGSPAFKDAIISLANGLKFRILAKNLSPQMRYVDKVLLNGEVLRRVYITHAELMKGGTLEFIMTDKPGSKWGTDLSAAPPSMSSASR